MKYTQLRSMLVIFSAACALCSNAVPSVASQMPVLPDAKTTSKLPDGDKPIPEKLGKDSLIVTSEYYIGPEDVLEIIVWRNADLSKVVTVRPDGRISLPLIGDIEATGLTPAELTVDIVNRLKQFKETPTVSVVIQQANSYGIYLLGEVAKSGRYFLKSKTTLIQAITIAGGFTSIAARNQIVVFRLGDENNNEVKLKASYDDIVLKDGNQQNIILKPGDTIVVPAENMVLMQ